MIRMTVSLWRALACAVFASAACAGHASAALSTATYVPCCSTEDIGSFRAELTYSYSGGTSATVMITLSNDVDPSLGGYITAIALNPNGTASGLSFVSSSSAAFLNITAPVSAPPYGTFAAGAGLNAGFLGGGNPSNGISTGSSATFTFMMTGSSSALAALNAETALSQTGYGMVVRFRGGEGGWSDKVIGCALPAPGALAVLGAVGMLSARRRRA